MHRPYEAALFRSFVEACQPEHAEALGCAAELADDFLEPAGSG